MRTGVDLGAERTNATNLSRPIAGVSAAAIHTRTLAAREITAPSDIYEQAQWLITKLNNRVALDPQSFRKALALAIGSRADRQSGETVTARASEIEWLVYALVFVRQQHATQFSRRLPHVLGAQACIAGVTHSDGTNRARIRCAGGSKSDGWNFLSTKR